MVISIVLCVVFTCSPSLMAVHAVRHGCEHIQRIGKLDD